MAGHSDNDLGLPSFDKPVKVAIVIAPYYTSIAEAQLSASRGVLEMAGVARDDRGARLAGNSRPPSASRIACRTIDGFVALGCVIRGATSHYDVVVNESARALTMLGLQGVCIGNGIITVENREQAEERADPSRLNTAGGAAEAALHLIALTRRFGAPKGGYRIQTAP
jgi:6,7-dimethyl-8-ribityllumazine synthase